MEAIRIFDLHCDTLTECEARGIGLDSEAMPHFAIRRIPEGVRWTQCMAIFIPDTLRLHAASDYCAKLIEVYRRECRLHADALTPVNLDGLRRSETQLTTLLTIEGGAALGGDLSNVEWLYSEGVRMMTLTWNGANEIAGGAATDEGFSPFGRRVVEKMERLGMVVDVSHLSDKAFWELCGFATRPFAASHSNARAVCGHRRNLTDAMFLQLVRRRGLCGLNYSDYFIRDGGGSEDIADLVRHMLHFLELGGEDVLALGSDFDGTDIPAYIDSPAKIVGLIEAMDRAGIPSGVREKILYENAARFFENV